MQAQALEREKGILGALIGLAGAPVNPLYGIVLRGFFVLLLFNNVVHGYCCLLVCV